MSQVARFIIASLSSRFCSPRPIVSRLPGLRQAGKVPEDQENTGETGMNIALRAAVVAALGLALSGGALAQNVCPENVVRIIVPFPPGGPTDVAARLIG